MPCHHPHDHLLLDYATGSLDEPVGLLVATHLALCPLCRSQVKEAEDLGGSLLETAEPQSLGNDLLQRTLDRLDHEIAPAFETKRNNHTQPSEQTVPEPLRSYLGGGLDSLSWRSWPALKEHRLLRDSEGYTTRLMMIDPGKAMVQHSHHGEEYTLVLRGQFHDGSERYLPGDVATADPSVDHQPVAGSDEPCLCLAVTTAPLYLTGRYSRFLNPILKI